MVKKLFLILMMGMLMLSAQAQDGTSKFDPAQFRQDLITFIVNEAGLTATERNVVVSVYDEYLTKKQTLFVQMSKYRHWNGTSDKSYADAIDDMDRISIELKTIQQTLHRKLLKILAAKKVYTLISAEKAFCKRYFQRFAHRR